MRDNPQKTAAFTVRNRKSFAFRAQPLRSSVEKSGRTSAPASQARRSPRQHEEGKSEQRLRPINVSPHLASKFRVTDC